jgi:hypothetical protein
MLITSLLEELDGFAVLLHPTRKMVVSNIKNFFITFPPKERAQKVPL